MIDIDFRFRLWTNFNSNKFVEIAEEAAKQLQLEEKIHLSTFSSAAFPNAVAINSRKSRVPDSLVPQHLRSLVGNAVAFSKQYKIISEKVFAFIIGHELTHIKQYLSRNFVGINYSYNDSLVEKSVHCFGGKYYSFYKHFATKYYALLPWEKEANEFGFEFCENFTDDGRDEPFRNIMEKIKTTMDTYKNIFDPDDYLITNEYDLNKSKKDLEYVYGQMV